MTFSDKSIDLAVIRAKAYFVSFEGMLNTENMTKEIIKAYFEAEKSQGRDWQTIEALLPDIDYILNLFASALMLGQVNDTNPIKYIYPVDLEKAGAVLTKLRAANLNLCELCD